jgi:hypothetical protein
MTTSAEVLDAVDLMSMSPGSLIDVETKNRHYQIECLGGNKMRISGHPDYCPAPMLAELRGSVDRKGTIQLGQIKRGKHLVFLLGRHNPVTTSKVLNVHVDQPQIIQPSATSRPQFYRANEIPSGRIQ